MRCRDAHFVEELGHLGAQLLGLFIGEPDVAQRSHLPHLLDGEFGFRLVGHCSVTRADARQAGESG